MKKTTRSPKKLAIDKTKLRPVVDEQLGAVTGGKQKYIADKHPDKFVY